MKKSSSYNFMINMQYTAIDKGLTGKNSTSLLRKPGGKEDFVRGRSGQYPFAPGGFESISEDFGFFPFRIDETTQLGVLPSLPPGFSRGLRTKFPEEDIGLDSTVLEIHDDNQIFVRSVHRSKEATTEKESAPSTEYREIDMYLREAVLRIAC